MGLSNSTATNNELLSSDMTLNTKLELIQQLKVQCQTILKDHPGNRCCKYALEFADSDEAKDMSPKGKSKALASVIFIVAMALVSDGWYLKILIGFRRTFECCLVSTGLPSLQTWPSSSSVSRLGWITTIRV
jgi:hypothetical protein